MSEGPQNFGIEDIPTSERLIGIDTLWHDDPAARAVYSSNPSFTEGTETRHRIQSVEGSLLARLDIAEALEQVYLDGLPPGDQCFAESPDDAEAPVPINTGLALDGLTWLRKNLGEESMLRRGAIATRSELIIKQTEDEQQHREAEARAEALARSQEEARRAEEEAEQTRQAKEEAQIVLQTESARQISAVVDNMQESFPYVNFQSFLHLAGKLSSCEGPDGKITVKEQKGFQTTVNNRAKIFLQDPGELVNDMSALLAAGDFLEEQGGHDEFPIAYVYVDKIGDTMAQAIQRNFYSDLSEEIVDQWFSAVDETANGHDTEAAEVVTQSGKRTETAQMILVNSGVLSNSLIAIAKRDPYKFVDRLYMFAGKGLDPTNELGLDMAMNVIGKCLEDPLVGREIIRAACFFEKPQLQEQALDLCITFRTCGLEWDQIVQPGGMNRLSGKEKSLLSKTLLPRRSNGAIDIEAVDALDGKSIFNEFEEKALTDEGRSSTLYGRLVDHTERTSPIHLKALIHFRRFLNKLVS